jgi:hypothetical protein
MLLDERGRPLAELKFRRADSLDAASVHGTVRYVLELTVAEGFHFDAGESLFDEMDIRIIEGGVESMLVTNELPLTLAPQSEAERVAQVLLQR